LKRIQYPRLLPTPPAYEYGAFLRWLRETSERRGFATLIHESELLFEEDDLTSYHTYDIMVYYNIV